jgi:hypothetical protein
MTRPAVAITFAMTHVYHRLGDRIRTPPATASVARTREAH